MKDFVTEGSNDQRVEQIIDANLDRAREGLRVLEDWARFGLGSRELVKEFKNFRQILGKYHVKIYKDSRNFTKDTSIGLTHKEQFEKKSIKNIISSNSARIQEALRVIEEYSKIDNRELSYAAGNIRYQIYSLEIRLLKLDNKNKLLNILRESNLYFISNPSPKIIEIIESVLKGGVRIIQHRFKGGSDLENLKEAKRIRRLCNNYKALLIINDRIDIAIACNADGVHLGQEDIDINSARRILGFSKIIGISANKELEIESAINNGCDYIGIGPVFETFTKKEKKPIGVENIKKLTVNVSIPYFIIGGVKQDNITILKNNGITQVAIISDLINSENPEEKAKMIIKYLSNEN